MSMISHRDFHPGNIIFHDDDPIWDDSRPGVFVDAKVIITDFGNAVIPLAFGYEDTGIGNEITYENINRRIEGSFRSLPPEVFLDPVNAFAHNPGCGEAWAIGILFYKLIACEDILNINSISEYSELVISNKLEAIIEERITKVEHKLNNNYILTSILRGLLGVKSSSRMPLGDAAGLFWDYRFGDLKLKTKDFQTKYIKSGRNHPPMRPDEHEYY